MTVYRSPSTVDKAPTILALSVINKVLEIERLVRERRNKELHQLIYELMRAQTGTTADKRNQRT